jgi:hypothetical protein
VSFVPAGFVGGMAAVLPFPWAMGWQSSIICPAGQDLTSQATTAFIPSEPYSDVGPDGQRGHTGGGYSYRCSGDDSSVDLEGQVMGLQFLAVTLLSYPFMFAAVLMLGLAMRRAANRRHVNIAPPPPVWPRYPPTV